MNALQLIYVTFRSTIDQARATIHQAMDATVSSERRSVSGHVYDSGDLSAFCNGVAGSVSSLQHGGTRHSDSTAKNLLRPVWNGATRLQIMFKCEHDLKSCL